jgi:hypothetical protein
MLLLKEQLKLPKWAISSRKLKKGLRIQWTQAKG